jgi:hypothetical protein
MFMTNLVVGLSTSGAWHLADCDVVVVPCVLSSWCLQSSRCGVWCLQWPVASSQSSFLFFLLDGQIIRLTLQQLRLKFCFDGKEKALNQVRNKRSL